MRIVGGTARGRALQGPVDAETIRPTADRVRQALFNVLGQTCEGLTVLDVYCGTGAFALEALSRGAVRAVLIDSGPEAVALSKANAEALGFTAQVEVIAAKALAGLTLLERRGQQFELVFCDPPYKQQAAATVLPKLTTVTTEGGVVVFEHSRLEMMAPRYSGVGRVLVLEEQREFGETTCSLFRLNLTGAVADPN